MYFGSSDDHAPHVQRIVPNGEMGICFYRGGEVTYDGVGRIRNCLSGQSMSYQDIVSDGRIDIVGAHFTTLGAALFFNAPLHSLFGAPTPLTALGDDEVDRLEEQIMEAGGYDLCFDLMDRFFLGRIGRTDIDPLNLRRLQRAYLRTEGDLEDGVTGLGEVQAGNVEIVEPGMTERWAERLKETEALLEHD